MNERERILATLRLLLKRYPDQRVGQIIENANGAAKEDLFYTPDANLEKRLRTYLADSYIR